MGMIDMRTGTCALCGHGEVIEAPARDFFGEGGDVSRPMAVTHQTKITFLGGERPDLQEPRGRLMQYVCRSCGYTQWFARNPDQIPIGSPHETRLLKGPEKDPPYR